MGGNMKNNLVGSSEETLQKISFDEETAHMIQWGGGGIALEQHQIKQ